MYELNQAALNPNNLYGVHADGVRFIEQQGFASVPCGLGCAGMGGLTMDGSGLFGTGIFGNGVVLTDLSTWGAGEYAAVAVGIFVLFSVASTGKSVGTKVSRKVRSISRIPQERRAARAAKLRQEAAQLEGA
jgi:hypothetical protein